MFCSSCGAKQSDESAQFCQKCGAKLSSAPPVAETDEWEVVVGDINDIPLPPPSTQNRPPEPPRPKKIVEEERPPVPPRSRQESRESEPVFKSAPNLLPSSLTQAGLGAWTGLSGVNSYDETSQMTGVLVLLLSLGVGIFGSVARGKRGLWSVLTLIASAVLALFQGGAFVLLLLTAIEWGAVGMMLMPLFQLFASFAAGLVTVFLAAKRPK